MVKDSDGNTKEISCLYLMNCAGPWANELIKNSGLEPKVEGVNNRGSHIVVKDLNLSTGLFFESPEDERIFFVLPWKGRTLIGTTEDFYSGDPDKQNPTDEDIEYIISKVNRTKFSDH